MNALTKALEPLAFLRKPRQVDEVALARLRERGQRAEQLLRDETLMEAFAEIERVYLEAWRGSAYNEHEKRERCHITINLLADLKNQLIANVREGQAAVDRLHKEMTRRPGVAR